jgi:carboxypeptidase C (cathepsin A)
VRTFPVGARHARGPAVLRAGLLALLLAVALAAGGRAQVPGAGGRDDGAGAFIAPPPSQAPAPASPAPVPAPAAPEVAAPAPAASGPAVGAALPEVARTVARSVELAGRTIAYTAQVGWLPVAHARGTARAWLFYTAYAAAPQAGEPARPVIFAFNGGPGAASMYLHLGALGPRRAALGPEGAAGPVPLVDNAESWLGLGDLVFIDPVGTGLSRAELTGGRTGDADDAFWETDADIDALYRFILAWLERHGRGRPVWLVGESYGGFRAARLADSLAKVASVRLGGAVLVSPALDRGTMAEDRMMPIGALLRVPTYAAVAWRHDRVPGVGRELAARDRLVAEAERWALGEGLSDLVQGDALPADRRKTFLAAYARFTGLSPALVAERDGPIGAVEFARSLLPDRRLGLYDASVAVPARGRDPTLRAIGQPLVAAMERYLADDLGLALPGKYTGLNPRTNRDWTWMPRGAFGYPSAAEALRDALTTRPALRVLVVHGRYDLVTPFAATAFAVAQLRLPPDRRAAVRLAVLDGGHMMYLHDESRQALVALATELIARPAAAAP